jgi:hypothetical protein
VLSLLGWDLPSGGEAALTRCVCTVTAHALALPITDHHHARSAVTGLYTVRALCTVIRRPPSDQAGLPWCQPTCPVCQWQAALFDLGAPGPTTALNAGRWAGDPRRASSRRHAAGPVPLPLRGGTWRHRTSSRGKGSPGPPSSVEGAWPVMVRSSHVAALDPLGSPGPRGQPESHPALLGAQGPQTSQSSGRVRRP